MPGRGSSSHPNGLLLSDDRLRRAVTPYQSASQALNFEPCKAIIEPETRLERSRKLPGQADEAVDCGVGDGQISRAGQVPV